MSYEFDVTVLQVLENDIKITRLIFERLARIEARLTALETKGKTAIG